MQQGSVYNVTFLVMYLKQCCDSIYNINYNVSQKCLLGFHCNLKQLQLIFIIFGTQCPENSF